MQNTKLPGVAREVNFNSILRPTRKRIKVERALRNLV